MKPIRGWEQAQAYDGSAEKVPAGGHVCKIMQARVETTDNGSEQVVLALDIAEGSRWDGYYKRRFDSQRATNPNAKWPCVFRQFTLDSAGNCNPYFKGMISCIERSNDGYAWNWDEKSLCGKMIGMIFREEEFMGSNGIATTVRPAFARTVERIREGVEVPEIKRLDTSKQQPSSSPASFTQVEEDDMLPF